VEGDDDRETGAADVREQVDADMTKVDVEQSGARIAEACGEVAGLAAGHEEGTAEEGLLPEAAKLAAP